MKKSVILLISIFTLSLMPSCGSEEPTPPPAEPKTNKDKVENLIENGMNEVFNEMTDQIKDTSSEFHQAIDTLAEIIEDNKEVIENGIKDGIEHIKEESK